jgi:16S rRNA processing protein RimM
VTNPETERLVVGLVRGIHGLRGAVRVEVLTDDPARFAVGSVVHREGETTPLTVAWVQEDGPGILVRFREIPDRDAAGTLRDAYLEVEVPRDVLPPGAYYWHQVQGCHVVTTDGRDLGVVEDVFRAGGSEVYVVTGGAWGEVMVPAVSAVIREFAPSEGRIVVDAEGLGLDEAPPVRKPRGRRTTRLARAGALSVTGRPDAAPESEVIAAPGASEAPPPSEPA